MGSLPDSRHASMTAPITTPTDADLIKGCMRTFRDARQECPTDRPLGAITCPSAPVGVSLSDEIAVPTSPRPAYQSYLGGSHRSARARSLPSGSGTFSSSSSTLSIAFLALM